MPALFAFVHHAAAFALVSALVLELVLVREELTLRTARLLQKADMVFGICAGVLLAAGLARVVYFEKGVSYYFHDAPFLAKFSLFLIVGLISIYPTVIFLSWRKSTHEGKAPSATPGQLRALRSVIHLELVGVVLILLFAALMAKGVGYFG